MEVPDSYDKLSLEIVHRWDDESLTVLYKHFYRALVAYSDRMVSNRFIAEEIVQNTFLKMWQKHNLFQNEAALKRYLYNSVRNGSISHLRHEQVDRRRINSVVKEFSEMGIDTQGDPALQREEIFRQLLRAIDSLPARQKEIFLLSVEGKSSSEIADELGIKPESVKKQRQRGFARLRELLRPEDFLLLVLLVID